MSNKKTKKIALVMGARPNFMKIAPIIEVMKENPDYFEPILIHTGQHYDFEMSKIFFQDLNIPEPEIYLGVGSGSHSEQTAKIMIGFEKVLLKEWPDLIMVVGDVNSTLACSIVSAKLQIPVAHVEAGLRSLDRTMPEEINRLVTDSISDFLFTTCEDANENLRREGISKEKIYFVGNVMIDTLLKYQNRAKNSTVLERIGLKNGGEYALLTLHRPSNVDNKEILQGILHALREISQEIPIIFPIHPRTEKQIENFGLHDYFTFHKFDTSKQIEIKNSINCMASLGYLDFFHLMANSKFVLTDSGGIQEETTVLGIPCLTLRNNTERPITVTEGTNAIVGQNPEKIIAESMEILNNKGKKGQIPKLWDGNASKRIINILKEKS